MDTVMAFEWAPLERLDAQDAGELEMMGLWLDAVLSAALQAGCSAPGPELKTLEVVTAAANTSAPISNSESNATGRHEVSSSN
jgi:hypothetical protein